MEKIAGVERLRLKFAGDATLLFRDLSLSVNQGEKVLLLGPSGCGKSTLLQVLTGIIPQSIDVPVKYDGITIPASWGYVFQDPDSQFCMPYVDEELAFVLENLRVPREEMPGRIRGLLEAVGLFLSDMHVPIQSLSQGMKQRLCIASALALQPDVLFLDEPTALLDPEGTDMVWETIRQTCADKTVIIVEHKIGQVIDFIDRVVLFNDEGEILADGPKDELFANCLGDMRRFGIWYPGVWNDYSRGETYRSLMERRMHSGTSADTSSEEDPDRGLALRNFKGYRGKSAKIAVSDAKVSSGEWIAVVGENGAGKSTLLLALMQLILTEGEYRLHGAPVSSYEQWSQEMAFVFQNPEFQFVTNSVYDEVAFSLQRRKLPESHIRPRATDMLRQFGLEEKRDKHPYQLSLGQKRRLSVAAAVIDGQRFLLLDEPTFGQDAKNTFAILEKLEYWRSQGTVIVMVTHDPEIVHYFATREWEIKDGKLIRDTKLPGHQESLGAAEAVSVCN